jgi:delta 1-pyrroline-5-carboxylate dehydrogenase
MVCATLILKFQCGIHWHNPTRRRELKSLTTPAMLSLARGKQLQSSRLLTQLAMRRLSASATQYPFLKELGLSDQNQGVYNGQWFGSGDVYTSVSPVNGQPIASVRAGTKSDFQKVVAAMDEAKPQWCDLPAPARGEIVRQIGEELRNKRDALGKLIALEMGKIYVEVRA